MRVVAALIDQVPLRVLQFLINILAVYSPGKIAAMVIFNFLFLFLADAVYEIVLTAKYGGTIGKLLLNIRVIDTKQQRISYWRSTGRYFSKMLSAVIMCIGYFMIAFTKKKQGLHDILAETTVVYSTQTLSKLWRTITLVTLLTIIALYTVWMCMAQYGAITSIFSALSHPLVANDPVLNAQLNCEKEFFFDNCILYTAMFNKQKLTNEQFLQLCNMTGGFEKYTCVSQLAMETNDTTLCQQLSFGYYKKSCEKGASTNDFVQKIAKVFAGIESASVIEEADTLNATGLTLSSEEDGYCSADPVKEFASSYHALLCLTPLNVGTMSVDAQGLASFNMDLFIKNSTGQFVVYNRNVGKGTQATLPNHILNDYTLRENISSLAPGNYNVTVVVHDELAKTQVSLHDQFEILSTLDTTPPQPPFEQMSAGEPDLLSYSAFLGKDASGSCADIGIDAQNALLPRVSKSEVQVLCVQPLNVTGFVIDTKGRAHFDMGIQIMTWGGASKVVVDIPAQFGDRYKILENSMLNGEYVSVPLANLSTGTYYYAITIYDTISGANEVVTDQFSIVG